MCLKTVFTQSNQLIIIKDTQLFISNKHWFYIIDCYFYIDDFCFYIDDCYCSNARRFLFKGTEILVQRHEIFIERPESSWLKNTKIISGCTESNAKTCICNHE